MSMTIAVSFLEAQRQQGADIAALVVDFVAAARTSLHVAIYDCRLGDKLAAPVVQALRDRAAHGVDVRIVYDAGKPGVSFPQVGVDPAPPGTADFINRIGDGCQARAITGGGGPMPRLMHHKYLIRDGKTPAGSVWTGSTNFTDDSWTLQENNIVRVASAELCAYYENDFEEIWSRGDIGTSGKKDTGTVRIDNTSVLVAFAPGEGRAIDHDVAHRISSVRHRLYLCSMLISSGAILGAIGDMLHAGRVQEYGGIYDRTQMEGVLDQWRGTPTAWKIAAFEQVARGLAGKRSTPYAPNVPHDFMHNKVVVADDTVVTGSFNLSHSATENAENVLIIQDRNLADRYVEYIVGLVRRYQNTQRDTI
jgi:phosphatidylserine/phosphatidylglycerophosphate/cardiolipin synthase-like enzyme